MEVLASFMQVLGELWEASGPLWEGCWYRFRAALGGRLQAASDGRPWLQNHSFLIKNLIRDRIFPASKRLLAAPAPKMSFLSKNLIRNRIFPAPRRLRAIPAPRSFIFT